MRRGLAFAAVLSVVLLAGSRSFQAAGQVAYRFTFPEPQHHWMQVDASFSGLGPGPLEGRENSQRHRIVMTDEA